MKEDGYKVKRISNLNILQLKNKKTKERALPISQHPLVKDGKFILQDFSSSLPVEILKNALKLDKDFKRFKNTNTNCKTVGVDSTAAPGNKTLQLTEICDKVYALERDMKRSRILQNRVEKANEIGNVTCFN